MARALRRGLPVIIVVLVGLLIVVGAGIAGAASAPPPAASEEPVPAVELPAESPPSLGPAATRHAALGVIVGMRGQFLGVKVKSQSQPVRVAIRPATAVRINGKSAKLEDLQLGDYAVVVGRPGPRGNLVARGVNVLRK